MRASYFRAGFKAYTDIHSVGFDFLLRVFVIEKHEVANWRGDEAVTTSAGQSPELGEDMKIVETAPPEPVKDKPHYDSLAAIKYLMFNLRALVPLMVSFLNGFIFSGKSIRAITGVC